MKGRIHVLTYLHVNVLSWATEGTLRETPAASLHRWQTGGGRTGRDRPAGHRVKRAPIVV